MELAERNFIQTVLLSGSVKDMKRWSIKDRVMLSLDSGRTQRLILTHLNSSIALLKAWGGKGVLQKAILRWDVQEEV